MADRIWADVALILAIGCGVAVLLIAEDPWPWPSLTVAIAWVLASVVHIFAVGQSPRRR